MKRIAALLLVLMLLCSTALADFESALHGLGGKGFEGAGFETPEEAVEAYVAFFNEGDVSGMLSTFAIETYVDNVDAQEYIEWLHSVNMYMFQEIPVSNDYIRSILIGERCTSLIQDLFRQYLGYNTPEEYKDLAEGKPVSLNEEGAAEAFIAAMSEAPMENWFGKIELSRFLSMEEAGLDYLADRYFSERNQQRIQRMADCYGCDELRDVPALLNIDGTNYLLCLQCARYGDQWYNISMNGNLANLLGIDVSCAGLVSMGALI